MSQTITCPHCQNSIDLDKIADQKYSDLLKEQELKLQQEQEKQKVLFEKEMENKTQEMRKKAQEFAEKKAEEERKKVELEMKDMQQQLDTAQKEREEVKKQQLDFMKKQRELEDKEKNFELEMEKKILAEKDVLEKKLKQRQEEETKILEEKLLKQQEKDLQERLEASQKQQEEMRKKEQEEFRKKELELLKQQEQMKRALDDAKRKAEQGSQQIQGDIQEEDLKQSLQSAFPIDRIEDVPTGIKGADIIQGVRDSLGQETGIIIWESKNTKAWQDAWISKLKDDKVVAKASIAILITTVLPKGLEKFGMVNDIMVTLPEYALQVVGLLRERLISISKVEKSLQGKDVKMEMLYTYLTSEEFGSKVNGIIDAFENLKMGIDTERRAMERIWKKREKELERVIMSTSMMQGDFEGIIGQGLPGGERLGLEMGEE